MKNIECFGCGIIQTLNNCVCLRPILHWSGFYSDINAVPCLHMRKGVFRKNVQNTVVENLDSNKNLILKAQSYYWLKSDGKILLRFLEYVSVYHVLNCLLCCYFGWKAVLGEHFESRLLEYMLIYVGKTVQSRDKWLKIFLNIRKIESFRRGMRYP